MRVRAEFEQTKIFTHRAEAGGAREALVRSFIAPRIPGHVQAAHSGEIATAGGEVSPQCDVVLFDRSTPPLFDAETYRIIPNECVYGVIEVKTSLDKTELLSACEKIRQVKALPKTAYAPPNMYTPFNIHGRTYDHMPTLGMIFAYGGSKIDTLAQHFWDWCDGRESEERPDGVWVLGEGYIQWTSPVNGLVDLYPQPGAGMLALKAPENDILFPFLLHLNSVLTHASMWPLDLYEYAGSSPLGQVVRVFPPIIGNVKMEPPIVPPISKEPRMTE